MKILLILKRPRSELDRQTIEVNKPKETSARIHEALRAWYLVPGDIIRIEEVE